MQLFECNGMCVDGWMYGEDVERKTQFSSSPCSLSDLDLDFLVLLQRKLIYLSENLRQR